MKSNLRWEDLRENICPACGAELKRKPNENYSCDCGFFCRYGRATDIINNIYNQNKDERADTFLRNHGIDMPVIR